MNLLGDGEEGWNDGTENDSKCYSILDTEAESDINRVIQIPLFILFRIYTFKYFSI